MIKLITWCVTLMVTPYVCATTLSHPPWPKIPANVDRAIELLYQESKEHYALAFAETSPSVRSDLYDVAAAMEGQAAHLQLKYHTTCRLKKGSWVPCTYPGAIRFWTDAPEDT